MKYRIALATTVTVLLFGHATAAAPAAVAVPASTTTAAPTTTTTAPQLDVTATATKPAVRLNPPTTSTTMPTPHLCERAFDAVLTVGGTLAEANLADRIAWRESRCTLVISNWNTRTRDDSWGPFQINYYGELRADRTKLVGPPSTNTESWERAAKNFLTLGRTAGWCHWQYPNYCS